MDLVQDKLKQLVKACGGLQSVAAYELGISPQHMSDLMHGRRAASKRILDHLGLKKVVVQK